MKRAGLMAKRTLWMLPLVAAVACGSDAQADGAEPAEGEEAGFSRVINVEVTPVGVEEFVESVRVTGTVEAYRDVVVSAEESGTVVEIFRDKGARVAAGDSLLRIDDRLLRAQVDEARARAALARETWERRKRLWEEDQVGSELAYLEARYGAEQAAAGLASLERRLERTVVTAPIEGVLDDRMVELGTLVNPGTMVARIVDLNPIKVVGGVPERYAADVRTGASARVTFDVLPEEVWDGRVGFAGNAVDARSRTYPVELTLPNPGGLVKPEMVANIEVVRRTFPDAVVADQDAVVRKEDGYVVFVVEEVDGGLVARSRAVQLGATQENRVVIEAGLAPGDRLVTVGQQQVANGDRVRIVGSGGDR
ncbi:MAG: efflux RND transporter periplasmic adaptor subunit [Gemmatimonadetes bacterium]|nr:efflux RND transporter periplasmic adaptor subunit [Gemmatimonadota bacterium]